MVDLLSKNKMPSLGPARIWPVLSSPDSVVTCLLPLGRLGGVGTGRTAYPVIARRPSRLLRELRLVARPKQGRLEATPDISLIEAYGSHRKFLIAADLPIQCACRRWILIYTKYLLHEASIPVNILCQYLLLK